MFSNIIYHIQILLTELYEAFYSFPKDIIEKEYFPKLKGIGIEGLSGVAVNATAIAALFFLINQSFKLYKFFAEALDQTSYKREGGIESLVEAFVMGTLILPLTAILNCLSNPYIFCFTLILSLFITQKAGSALENGISERKSDEGVRATRKRRGLPLKMEYLSEKVMRVSELHASQNMRIPNKTIAPALTAGG